MLATLVTGGLQAQNVTVDASIDSFQLFIGEQAKIKLEVSYDAGKRLKLPPLTKTLMEGVEIVDKQLPDTQYLNNGKRLLVTEIYTITSFDSALYTIPPFEVTVDGKPYYSKELALKVLTIPVDTTKVDSFFGPKTIWDTPLTFKEWAWLIVLLLLVCGTAVLVIYFINRYVKNKPIIRIVKVVPPLPAHVKALNEIERIKQEKLWERENNPKQYYTELTDVLRTYMSDRYGFNAMEMTSDEIIAKLRSLQDKEALHELITLLETADLVKFAKHNPLMNENDMNLVNAIDFVNETKQPEAEQKPQETKEIKVVDQRSRKAKMWLLGGIIALSVVCIVCLVFLIRNIYYLWF